mgnify:CR=1 FL=1
MSKIIKCVSIKRVQSGAGSTFMVGDEKLNIGDEITIYEDGFINQAIVTNIFEGSDTAKMRHYVIPLLYFPKSKEQYYNLKNEGKLLRIRPSGELLKDKEVVLDFMSEYYLRVENKKHPDCTSIYWNYFAKSADIVYEAKFKLIKKGKIEFEEIPKNQRTAYTILEFYKLDNEKYKDELIRVLNEGKLSYINLPKYLKTNKEFVLPIVKNYPNTYKNKLSDELKNDKDIAIAVVNGDPYLYYYFTDKLKKDRDVALEGVKRDGYVLKYLNKTLKNDDEIVYEAFKTGLVNANEDDHRYNNLISMKQLLLQDYMIKDEKIMDKVIDYINEECGDEDCELGDLLEAIHDEYLNKKGLKREELKTKIKCKKPFEIDDEEKALQKISCWYSDVNINLSNRLRNDKDFMLKAGKANYHVLKYIGEELCNDEEFLLSVAPFSKKGSDYNSIIDHIGDELSNNKDFILEAAKEDIGFLKFIGNKLRDDKDFILEGININPFVFECVSERLKNDKEVASKAFLEHDGTIKYIGDKLKDDEGFMLYVIKRSKYAFQYASDRLKNNREFVMKVFNLGGNVSCVGDDLKDDREFILNAIKNDQFSLRYASERLRDDKELALEAIKKEYFDLNVVSERLKDDREVVLEAIKVRDANFQYVSERLRDDNEIALLAIKETGYLFQYASERLRDDKKTIMENLNSINESQFILYTSDRLKDDEEFMLEAIKNFPCIFSSSSKRLLNDKHFVMEAFKLGSDVIQASNEVLRDSDVIELLPEDFYEWDRSRGPMHKVIR